MRRKGFTLIELLVVVAIIALLVSILLPALGRARDLTKTSVCMAHMRGCGAALGVYSSEVNGQYPTMFQYSHARQMSGLGFDRAWWSILTWAGYLPTTEFIYCPNYKGDQIVNYTEADMDEGGWTASAAWEGSFGFMVPYSGPGYMPDSLAWPCNIYEDDHIVVEKHIRQPGSELLLFDSIRYGVMPNSTAHTYEQRVNAMSSEYSDGGQTYLHNTVGLPLDIGEEQKWDGLSIRHGHASNALFFDGHVEKVDGEAFWQMKNKEPDCMWDGF